MNRRLFIARLFAQTPTISSESASEADFERRWNVVAEAWKLSSDNLNAGLYPAGDLLRLGDAIDHLKAHPYWPKRNQGKKGKPCSTN